MKSPAILIAGVLSVGGVPFHSALADADERLDRRGNRIDERLDRRGERFDDRLDHRGDRIEDRYDARTVSGFRQSSRNSDDADELLLEVARPDGAIELIEDLDPDMFDEPPAESADPVDGIYDVEP